MIVNVIIFAITIIISGEITKSLSKHDNLNEFINRIDAAEKDDYGKIPVKKYLGANGYIEILDGDLNIIYSGCGDYSRKYTHEILNFTSDIDKNTSYSIEEQISGKNRIQYFISEYSYEEGENREYDFKNSILSGVAIIDENYNIIYSDMPLNDVKALSSSDIDELFDNNDSTFSVKHLIPTDNGETVYLIAHLDAGLRPIDIFMNRLITVSIILSVMISVSLNLILSGMAARKIRDKIRDKNYHTAGYLHDIGNSLTSIMGYAGELSRGNNTAEENETFLKIVLGKAEEAAELSRQLNEFNKLNSSDYCLNKKPSDVAAIFKGFIARSYSEFKAHGFITEIDISLGSAEVFLDEVQILRVFNNFKNNFMKYCESGTMLYFGIYAVENTAVIEIGNNGLPIEPSIRKQIFRPYIKGKNSAHGSGLGLALAERIISLHSGRIGLADEPCHGCTNLFRIELPVSRFNISN